MKIIKKVGPRRRFLSPIKYRNEYCIFHIVRFSINAQKSAVFYSLVVRNLGDNDTLSRIKQHQSVISFQIFLAMDKICRNENSGPDVIHID